MASTNKTPKLGLNQWVGTDQFMREDFNRDNAKLDTAVGSLQGQGYIFGHYYGNNSQDVPMTLEMGFRPSAVLFISLVESLDQGGGLLLPGKDIMDGDKFICRRTSTGVEICARQQQGAGHYTIPRLAYGEHAYIAFR